MTNLLLIDDDEELCSELEEVLLAEGFKVDVAFDGTEGLRCLQDNSYHVIILDLRLPGLNGYGVLKGIRQMAKPMKVLVLSGRPLGDAILKEDGVCNNDEEKILELADAVMTKPFMVDNFIQQIQRLVEKSQ